MDNPYETPILALGLLAGIVAGLISGKQIIRWLNRIYILLSAAFVCWLLEIHLVDWAYTHPFDPNDGGPRAFAAIFGWLAALIYPILPAFILVSLSRITCIRYFQRAQNLTTQSRGPP